MKKARDICIRALCAIFVGVVLGCSGASGGNDIENDGGNNDNEQETGWKQPAYMNVTEEFGGQRFVGENYCFYGNPNKDVNFDTYYNDANQYINSKVAELDKLWQEKNTGSTLSNQIGTALGEFNNGTSIDQKIDNNYVALAPVFKTMENNTNDYHAFKVSYWKLAADAYNQSLGEYAGETTFTTNEELRNKSTNYFIKELNKTTI